MVTRGGTQTGGHEGRVSSACSPVGRVLPWKPGVGWPQPPQAAWVAVEAPRAADAVREGEDDATCDGREATS